VGLPSRYLQELVKDRNRRPATVKNVTSQGQGRQLAVGLGIITDGRPVAVAVRPTAVCLGVGIIGEEAVGKLVEGVILGASRLQEMLLKGAEIKVALVLAPREIPVPLGAVVYLAQIRQIPQIPNNLLRVRDSCSKNLGVFCWT